MRVDTAHCSALRGLSAGCSACCVGTPTGVRRCLRGVVSRDRGHGAARLQETGVVDAVAGQFRGDGGPPSFGEFGVARARAQRAAQVGFFAGEQAVADLTVRGEPHPVAGSAERAGHGGDHADGGRAAVDQEQFCGALLRWAVSAG